MSSSFVIPIQEGTAEAVALKQQKNSFRLCLCSVVHFIRDGRRRSGARKVIHSIKVGIALILVSLIYLIDPLYKQFGENAMWAVMTIVVIFDFFAGATLSKGINRGIGTILGGLLGCLVSIVGQRVDGVGKSVVVCISILIFSAAATYSRSIPRFKKKYDYGAMIFILTFSLVVVSDLREEHVIDLARERLVTVGIGFAVCIFTSLFIFPIWASDELHDSVTSKFEDVASSLEGCLEEYFSTGGHDKKKGSNGCNKCKTVLNSKTKDEMLANFARWEPCHGKFGFSYPWNRYLQIGENLRDLAATVTSLRNCLQSHRQPPKESREPIREPSLAVMATLVWTLRELRGSVRKMRRFQAEVEVLPKLMAVRVELTLFNTQTTLGRPLEKDEELAIASFMFLLTEIVEKTKELAKEVEELGEVARFPSV
ncbi:hypothetical protein SAY86_022955 [Trapa natans]|uniref:Aluminum-activated malate transporter n=1 Tax=Trapa natans TaxID=22666 RepID=A0AAN7M9X7_TRANT|nr:hypothetical protein SAY86_022955 [Trapa natans]